MQKNLLEGALLVIVVLFAAAGEHPGGTDHGSGDPAFDAALTMTGMVQTRTSANLMSLGALDFGLIVDGAVIIVENCLKRFGEAQHRAGRLLTRDERFSLTARASAEVIQPAIFGVFIITVVYIPIFALTGVEGKMFQPMAITVVIALVAAMVLSLTFIPAAVAMFVTGKVAETDNAAVALARRGYAPALRWTLRYRAAVVVGAALLAVVGLWGATRLGSEFVPSLDEGDLAVQALRMPGTGLEQSVAMQAQIERALMKVPEVANVFARTGTAEIATDPMPPSISDGYLMLKDRKDWPDPRKEKSTLENEISAVLAAIPGQNYEMSQPIQLRFNELISGVRSDVAVKIYGDDIQMLQKVGQQIMPILQGIPGARGAKVEQIGGLPTLSIVPDRNALARYGLSQDAVQQVVVTAVAGTEVGQLFDGDRRFDIVVRMPEALRTNLAALGAIPVPLPTEGDVHQFVPLGELASMQLLDGPNQVSRENGKRRLTVTANVRERDLGSFVAELQSRIDAEVTLPEGYWLDYGGTFQQLQSARDRLALVVPLALALIFILLFSAFGSVRDAAIVFSGVPLALVGGVAALTMRDHSAVDLRRRCRLHRPVGRGGAERGGDGVVHPQSAGAKARDLDEAIREGALHPAAAGADDRARREPRFRPDGVQCRPGIGGTTAARHRRHRRHPLIDPADAAGAACALPPIRARVPGASANLAGSRDRALGTPATPHPRSDHHGESPMIRSTSYTILAAALLALASMAAPTRAADEHDHDHDHAAHEHAPKYGGIVEEANGMDYELVVKPDMARLYVDGHDAKVSVKGGKATVTFLANGQSSKLVLLPAGENWFEVKGAVPSGPGLRAVAVVMLRGKTSSVRFAMK